MKVVFFGGGSFRTLPIVRAAMRERGVLDGGEIQLVDLNLRRAETVGRLIQQTPEWRRAGGRIGWTTRAEAALDGADMVSVSMPVGSSEVCTLSDQACWRHGFHGSDQLSVSGAFRSLTGGPIVLGLARKMERHCPRAWLVDFANPVAVYSGLVNNHTRIRALGVCGGFMNHRWDLTRLMGRDEYCDEYDVFSAGVNHLSFLLRGTYRGQDLYRVLGRHLKPGWQPPKIAASRVMARSTRFSLRKLYEMYHRYGVILYSLESDGMMHLFPDELRAFWRPYQQTLTRAQIRANARAARARRVGWDAEFRAHLDQPLDAAFWAGPGQQARGWFAPAKADLTALILRALAGRGRAKFAASHINRGAVRGFKDRTVLEYTLTLDQKGLTPARDLAVPDVFHGLITSLATHQTLLGDAVATRDPQVLAQALLAYPLHQFTRQARALFRELLTVHRDEIDPVFQKAKDYL